MAEVGEGPEVEVPAKIGPSNPEVRVVVPDDIQPANIWEQWRRRQKLARQAHVAAGEISRIAVKPPLADPEAGWKVEKGRVQRSQPEAVEKPKSFLERLRYSLSRLFS